MQGPQPKPTSTVSTGNWPWYIMVEGDKGYDGLTRV
jgi:hypothetical protein